MKKTKKVNNELHLDVTYRYGIIIGLVAGLICLFGGIALCLLGLTGSIEFLFEGGGLKARLWNASPGITVALLGALIVWRYKPKTKQEIITKESQTQRNTPSGGSYTSSTYERSENKTSGSRLSG